MSTKYIVNNLPNQTINGDEIQTVKYKVYTALITQTGTGSIPTANVLQNTIGEITWDYISPGIYTMNSDAAFVTGKTYLNNQVLHINQESGPYIVLLQREDENTISLSSNFFMNEGDPVDSILSNHSLEIRVYLPVPDPDPVLTLGFDNISNLPVANPSSVSDWNTFFDLPANGTPFTSVSVFGNNINLFGASNIELRDGLFANNTNLISVVDTDNCITTTYYNCFFGCTSLQTIDLPQLTTAYSNCFAGCTSLQTIDLPELISTIGVTGLGMDLFSGCTSLTSALLPKIVVIGIGFFRNCTSLTTIYLPLCVGMGQITTGNDNVFFGITGLTITLTIAPSLMTNNGGNPDGDIQYLQANNTVTITYL